MNLLRRIAFLGLSIYWRAFKPVVLGARALVIRDGKDVLLVRLSYAKGWCLPGGGVKKGESFYEGVARELKEECGIAVRRADLFGIFLSKRQGKVDHVAVYVVQKYTTIPEAKPDPEISEARFCPLSDLPTDTTPATRRRIQEYLGGGKTVSIEW